MYVATVHVLFANCDPLHNVWGRIVGVGLDFSCCVLRSFVPIALLAGGLTLERRVSASCEDITAVAPAASSMTFEQAKGCNLVDKGTWLFV
jgi:hypothetical protein